MKKLKRFQNEHDGEELSPDQQAAASNETLIDNLMAKHENDDDVQELVKRFAHAIECIAQPNLYHRDDVKQFVSGTLKSLLPRYHKSVFEEYAANHLKRADVEELLKNPKLV